MVTTEEMDASVAKVFETLHDPVKAGWFDEDLRFNLRVIAKHYEDRGYAARVPERSKKEYIFRSQALMRLGEFLNGEHKKKPRERTSAADKNQRPIAF